MNIQSLFSMLGRDYMMYNVNPYFSTTPYKKYKGGHKNSHPLRKHHFGNFRPIAKLGGVR